MSSAGETSAAGTAFLQQLRGATAAQHQQLEGNALSTALMSATVTTQQYMQYLIKMQGVLAFYEKSILPVVAEVVPDAEQRKKLHLIQQDLGQLGCDCPPDAAIAYRPITGKIGLPFALGYMYVIEGSALGGRIILKHIHNKLAVSEDSGAAFFNGYGADTSMYWKNFLQILSVQAQHDGYPQEIINGAKDAFTTIHKYFQQPG